MAGDPPSRHLSATSEGANPPKQNPGAAANPGNIAGGSNPPRETVPRRHGKDPVLSSQSANHDIIDGRSSQQYAEQAYQLTAAEQEVIRLNRILAERDRQLAEAHGKRAGRPRKDTSRQRNETKVIETETIHTVV